MQPDQVKEACGRMAELQYRRKFHITTINRNKLAAMALIRRAAGFDPAADEKDREKVAARAQRIFAKVHKTPSTSCPRCGGHVFGEPCKQDEADQAIFAVLEADLMSFNQSLVPLEKARAAVEKDMVKIARTLPIFPWAKDVKGFGDLALAAILGETGDLSEYDNPSKVWKRLGLAPYAGKAGSTWKMVGGLGADEWTEFGYAPKRRAVVYADVQTPLIKHQWRAEKDDVPAHAIGPYGEHYGRYKTYLIEKNLAGGFADRAEEICDGYARRKKTAPKENAEGRLTAAHINNMALRYMVKKLISDLWSEWRRASETLSPSDVVPVVEELRRAA